VDNVFLKVTSMTRVGGALKSKKLSPKFICLCLILEQIDFVACQIALPPNHSKMSFMCSNFVKILMTFFMLYNLI